MKHIKNTLLILAVVAVVQSCTVSRAFMYWGPNITDHKIFHNNEIYPSDQPFQFKKGNEEVLNSYIVKVKQLSKSDTIDMPLDDFLSTTPTTAFLVIHNDSILFERYYKGYKRDSIAKIHSVSKSITSILTGIAIDEGYIASVHDPVTKYVPELKKRDPHFQQLTIEHLLNMRAGFKFNENNYFPLSRATSLYYGTNHLGKLKRAKFKHNPGEKFEYQSSATALLGVIVERTTGKKLSQYLQEKIWTPLGMEYDASWDIDDKRHRSNKAHVGLNMTAIDLAKIGRLYLNNGSWDGKQVVSAEWVTKSTTIVPNNRNYHYKWWRHRSTIANPNNERGYVFFSDSTSARKYAEEKYPDQQNFIGITPFKGDTTKILLEKYDPNLYYAEGIREQFLFICPTENIAIVRIGEYDKSVSYPLLAVQIIRKIKESNR